MSSFTDTKAREKTVNFVDYFLAGEGYYVSASSKYHPNGLASLCGHSVAVESGTTEQSDAQAEAKTCAKHKSGAVKVLSFSTQNEATTWSWSAVCAVPPAGNSRVRITMRGPCTLFISTLSQRSVSLSWPSGNGGVAMRLSARVTFLIW
jgi:hypothetical protein